MRNLLDIHSRAPASVIERLRADGPIEVLRAGDPGESLVVRLDARRLEPTLHWGCAASDPAFSHVDVHYEPEPADLRSSPYVELRLLPSWTCQVESFYECFEPYVACATCGRHEWRQTADLHLAAEPPADVSLSESNHLVVSDRALALLARFGISARPIADIPTRHQVIAEGRFDLVVDGQPVGGESFCRDCRRYRLQGREQYVDPRWPDLVEYHRPPNKVTAVQPPHGHHLWWVRNPCGGSLEDPYPGDPPPSPAAFRYRMLISPELYEALASAGLDDDGWEFWPVSLR